MPHRKSPRGVAKSFILRTGQYDLQLKENINLLTDEDIGAILAELSRAFPSDPPTTAVLPEEWLPIRGLVLTDTRGDGVFQV